MTSKDLGLIEKYQVERTDGKPVRWCFVLEDTDPLAPAALRAYASVAEAIGYVELAYDLRIMADRLPLPRLTEDELAAMREPDHDAFLAHAEPR